MDKTTAISLVVALLIAVAGGTFTSEMVAYIFYAAAFLLIVYAAVIAPWLRRKRNPQLEEENAAEGIHIATSDWTFRAPRKPPEEIRISEVDFDVTVTPKKSEKEE